jgi:pimeloyl-ACP methyl ester carboxylesterase
LIHTAALRRASLVFIVLAACQPESPAPVATLPPTQAVIETITPSPIPTITLTASATPTVEELIYPFTIDGLREHDFQSGKINIRSTLSKNDKFTTYLIDYPSEELTITGVMQIPEEMVILMILLNHGFFSRSVYNSGDGTDRAAAFLAEHGYITLASDYRSWGGSEVGTSFFYSGLAMDVINLINAIPYIKQADPERIGMWGHSMGGGVTMRVLTIDSRVKGAVLYSPVSADFADIIERWGPGCFGDIAQGELIVGCNSSDVIPGDLPLNLQDAYRFAASDADMLKEISPFYHLDYVTAPVQIHYGTEDGKFLSGTPPQWSVKLTEGLRDAGKQTEMYQYEGR